MNRGKKKALTILCMALQAMGAAAQTNPAYSVVYAFSARTSSTNADGAFPNAALIQATDGRLYGTASSGGPSGYGTVFRLDLTGGFSVLGSFDGANGRRPEAPLMQASDGNFYGTTANGGAQNIGTVFRITPAGTITRLHAFSGTADGQYPLGGLVQNGAGELYGTAESGGTNGYGTVFKITTNGALTQLLAFNSANGAYPYAGLTRGNDGNFYGTTTRGGASGAGTVFRITPAGAFTSLASFGYTNGSGPRGALIQARDGYFYGTTRAGGVGNGTNGFGTVFRMTPAGKISTVGVFNGVNGNSPGAGVVEGDDDCFYGTTEFGGPFRMNPNGTIVLLVPFNGSNGMFARAGIIQAADGNYYGCAQQGAGPPSQGGVFRLNLRPSLMTPKLVDNARAILWNGLKGLSYQVQYTGESGSTQWTNLGAPILATDNTAGALDAAPVSLARFYRVLLKP